MKLSHGMYPTLRAVLFFGGILVTFALPSPFVSAQTPVDGWISVAYPGACTAEPIAAVPFVLIGATPGLYIYVPGSIVHPYGPPSHPGQAVLGWAGGFLPCLALLPCPPVGEPCPLPFPPHPGGLLILESGTFG